MRRRERGRKGVRWLAAALAGALLTSALPVWAGPGPDPNPGPNPNPGPTPGPNPAPDPQAAFYSAQLAGEQPSGEQKLFLQVELNGRPMRRVAPFLLRDGRLFARTQTLGELGLRFDDLVAGIDGWIALGDIHGLSHSYDAAQQRIALTAVNGRRQTVELGRAPRRQKASGGRGVLFNYDLYLQSGDGFGDRGGNDFSATLWSEQRLFGDWGVLSHTGIAANGGSHRGDARPGYLRLDTTWTWADQDNMRTISAGDFINAGLPWTRPVRLGGLQVRRNFALRPDLITYPLPVFAGEAAVPSSVELYVNSVRQYTGELDGGPFVIRQAPSLTGAGQATVVVRDALGRETSQTLSLYVSPQLLAHGLSDYALEAGVPRQRYGVSSNVYGNDTAVSGSWRYGLRDWLTLEAHGEATRGLRNGGAGAVVQLGRAGLLNASYVASVADRQSGRPKLQGRQYALGYQYQAPAFSISADTVRADAGYRDLAALAGARPQRRQDRVLFSLPLGGRGNAGVSYLRSDFGADAGTPESGPEPRPINRSRLVSLFFNRSLSRRVTLFANAFRDLDREHSDGVSLGLSVALDNRMNLGLDAGRNGGDATRYGFNLHRSADYGGGWGWGVRARDNGDDERYSARANYLGSRGEIDLGIDRFDGRNRPHAGARGSLVLMDGAVLPGRPIHDGFAVVSTAGLTGVPVLHENRRIGTTDSRGHLLVTGLNAYQTNRIAIDPLSLPLDRALSSARTTATPRWLAGTLVEFPTVQLSGATLVLVDADGRPFAPGTRGRVEETGADFVVGYEGQAFITGLQPVNTLTIGHNGGTCRVRVDYRAQPGRLPYLGRFTCRR